jgi:hypothetical protein
MFVILYSATTYAQTVIKYKGQKVLIYTKNEHTKLLKELELGRGAIEKVKLYKKRLEKTTEREALLDRRAKIWQQERLLRQQERRVQSNIEKSLSNQVLISTRMLGRKDKQIAEMSKANNNILKSPLLWFVIGGATVAVVVVTIKVVVDNTK